MVELLRTMVKGNENQWAAKLNQVNWALNARILSSCGKSPHHLVFGYKARAPRTFQAGQDEVTLGTEWDTEQRDTVLNHIREEAREDILDTRIHQDLEQNRRSGDEPPFEVGDWVLLSSKDLNTGKGTIKKLLPKWIGPYRVVATYKDYSTYKIDLPKRYRIHDVFHASKLKLANGPKEDFWPDPEEVVDTTEYLVEEITKMRRKGRQRQCLVKWQGYDESTWEPVRNMLQTTAYQEFMKRRRDVTSGEDDSK